MVSYLRDSEGLAPSDALIDAWLLSSFPGRTLDEIDAMDWPRYLRAREAQAIEAVERTRSLRVARKLNDDDIAPETWEAIKRHDELVAEARPDSTDTPQTA